ncbi:MAG: hypothetical protein N3A54_00095 [Patescibacteria group bacterium]|nr:hypothetical protein [Patescibacteria group bacterium]
MVDYDPSFTFNKNKNYPVCMSPLMIWYLKQTPFTYIARLKNHEATFSIYAKISSEIDAMSWTSHLETVQPKRTKFIYKFLFPEVAEVITSEGREDIILGEIQKHPKDDEIYKVIVNCNESIRKAALESIKHGFSPIVPYKVRFFGFF